jgi:tetratricopeptide (TPR) repeat protein
MVHQALEIYQKEFGPESLEAAASLTLLGRQLMGQYKRPEAARAHGEALAIRRRLLGEEHADTAATLSELAAVYGEEGKVVEAEAMAREALRIRRKLDVKNSPQMADMLRNLCMILGNAGKWNDAEATAREVLAMRRDLYGLEHPSVAGALHDLAWAVNATKKFEEAQSLEAEAVLMRERLLGNSHPDVTITLNSLGKLLGNRGEKQASEAVLRAVLSIQREMLADDHPATLETFGSLARVLQEQGKKGEAESTWRTALEGWHKRGKDDEPDRLYALRGLGETLEEQGKWSEAETVWRESLPLWRKREGIEEQQSMYTLRKLGLALEAERKWSEAEAVHREALSIAGKKGDQDSEALVDLNRVVRTLTAQKKLAEAQQLLDKILTPAFVAKPACADLLIERVNVMGRRGQWQKAAADIGFLLQLQPGEHYHYHRLAALLAVSQSQPDYERLCQKLVVTFTNSPNPYVNERVAQDCLLLPKSGVDLALIDKLADTALTIGSDESSLAYFRACKAMAEYRLGHFPQAIEWAQKANQSTAADPPAKAKAFAVSAMANWQLGQKEVARAALADGDRLAPKISADSGVVDLGESWVAWILARVSLDEATELIRTGSTKHHSNPP